MTVDRAARGHLGWRIGRGLLLTTGAAVFCLGVAVVVVPETARLVPVEAAIRVLGSDYVVVAVVGLLSIGLAALFVATRHVRGVDEATPPVVEGVQSASYPGTEFDRAAASSGVSWSETDDEDCRPRLREAAIRVTMRRDGCSRGVAERRVARGEWTDDSVAAGYLRGSSSDSASGWTANRDDRSRRRTVEAILNGRAGEDGDASERRDIHGERQ